jgi:hypothetical protein
VYCTSTRLDDILTTISEDSIDDAYA